MMVIALCSVVVQAVLIGGLLWLCNKGAVRLGQYTAALMATNKSNLLVLDESNRVRRELRVLLDARAVDLEIAAQRAANFVAPDDELKHERSA
jgi:hypothetical protein